MSYSLYIDDCRHPETDAPEGEWKIARTFSEMVDIVEEHGHPDHVSFDHDLGEDVPGGHDCAEWLVEQEVLPDSYNIHSANHGGGRRRIEAVCESGASSDQLADLFRD